MAGSRVLKQVTIQSPAATGAPPGEGAESAGEALSMQDLCREMARQERRLKQLTLDDSITQARERLLSARSLTHSARMRTHSAHSSRTHSRLSQTSHPSRKPFTAENTREQSEFHNDSAPGARREASRTSSRDVMDDDVMTNDVTADDVSDAGSPAEADTPRTVSPNLSLSDCDSRESPSGSRGARAFENGALVRLQYDMGDQGALLRSYTSLAGGGGAHAAPSACGRSRSALSTQADSVARSMSRQCCDVLGPKVCHDCAMLQRRLKESTRHQVTLTHLQVTERNYADTIALGKRLPHLSAAEIEDRVVVGDIARVPLRERLYARKARLARDSNRSAASVVSTQSLSVPNGPPTQRYLRSKTGTSDSFFLNIRDLNCKLLMARLGRCNGSRTSLGFTASRGSYSGGGGSSDVLYTPSERTARSATPSARPPHPLQPYEPPLVPKVCQSAEPSFFAGLSMDYRLPDRLPDQAVAGQVSDLSTLNAAWTDNDRNANEA